MKKYIATLVLLPLLLALAGCPLATVTESFEYDVLEENNDGQPFDLTGQDGWTDVIDLTKDETFNDNKGKIDEIDRITFMGAMHTLNDADATVDIFFRAVPEKDEPTPKWLIILEGLEVGGDTTADLPFKITYEESEGRIQNFTQFQALAKDGIMELALVTRTGNDQVLVTKLMLYIALSGG